jgi:hypothetical protein
MNAPLLKIFAPVKALRRFFVLLVAAMAATTAVAGGGEATDENGLEWFYTTEDYQEAKIAGTLWATMGPGGNISLPTPRASISSNTVGNVTVPATLDGYSVTGIGKWAFIDCSLLTGVTIHGNVKYIDDSAFSGCSSLSSITIPDSVGSIASSAFYNCTGLTRMFLGNGVTNIASNAFSAAGLETVYVSDIYAGPAVPYKTVGLSLSPSGDQEISGPLQVTGSCAIPGATMRYTTDGTTPTAASPVFQSYTVDSQMTLTVGAFLNGELVLTTKGTYSFAAGTEIVDGRTWKYRPYGDGVEIYGRIDAQGLVPAASPKPTGVVTIPSTLGGLPVTCVGELSFEECEGLTGVTFPASVTNIGNSAFRKCTGLTGVAIPSGVARIGRWAFENCSSLANVTIPDSVTSIGVHAFFGCHASLYDTNSIPGVWLVDGWTAVSDVQLSGDLVLTGIRGIGEGSIAELLALTRVWIADDVPYVGESAFEDCSALTSVAVGNGVKLIGDRAFYYTGPATVYVSDIYEGPRVDGMVTGLALTLPGEQILSGPTAISVNHSFDAVGLLRYTTDGTIPTAESPLFVPFTVSSAMTVTVGMFFDDTRILVTRARYWMGKVETPDILTWSEDDLTAEVSISCDTAGAVIRYTLDGTDPTEDSAEYTGAFFLSPPIGKRVTIKARAFKAEAMSSDVATDSFMRTCSMEEAVGCPELVLDIDGDGTEWLFEWWDGHSDEVSLQSGTIGDGEESRLWTTVEGPGLISFWWKTSCEETSNSEPQDHVEFRVDGVRVAWLDSETDWQKVEWFLAGNAEDSHTLEWRYVKDAEGEAGDDRAWLDDVSWRSDADAFVSLGAKGTVVEQDGGYLGTANDGVTLVPSDFIFKLSPDAYVIDIAAGGKTATVRLKKPEIGLRDGATGVTPDPDDPLHMLVIAPVAMMATGPTAGAGETLRALPVKTYPGLWYRASWGNALDDLSPGAKAQATGDVLYLGVIRQDGTQGFYRMTVSEE